jgi:hypothetical protein
LTPRISADVSADQAAHITSDDRVFNHELLICATHFIGDGMALHQFANDFFGLLNSAFSQQELDQLVADEWKQRWGQTRPDVRFHTSLLFYWLKMFIDRYSSERRGKLGHGAESLPSRWWDY